MFGWRDDEVDDGAHLRLRRRIRARAQLLELLPPRRGKVAVEVEPLHGPLHAQRVAVVVLERALGHDPVVRAARLGRLAPDHEARLVRVRLPDAVGVGDAHLQDQAVAVDVLDRQSLDVLVAVRVGPRARADPLGLGGERPFGAVRVDARAHVERAGVERARDVGVHAVLRDQRVQEVEVRRGRRHFGRVDVAVDPERGLLGRRAGRGIRHGDDPDVASLVALAGGLDRHEVRVLARERVQQVGELGVAVEAVEGDGGHGGAGGVWSTAS